MTLRGRPFAPVMVGGMGVDVSTPALALSVSGLGGIAHLSDAMIMAIVDRHYGTRYTAEKREKYKASAGLPDKSTIHFDLDELREAMIRYVRPVMEAKRGTGAIFINLMEKLTMADPRGTLKARMEAAMDAGIDGLTLGAGLHLSSLELIAQHARFRDVLLGIIVSSARALKLFLCRARKIGRMPDYIVVEGPLAGGHLGFGMDWRDFDLTTIVREVQELLKEHSLNIPVIPAGGIFTGSDAVRFVEDGAAGVQVATRFTVTHESGLPEKVKQTFFASEPEQVVVNTLSSSGYPMRMLQQSPAVTERTKPTCEAYGYVLDGAGKCLYNDWYNQQQRGGAAAAGEKPIDERMCLCSMMFAYKVWTCGHTVSRLKETSNRLPNGSYQLLTAEHVFNDYMRSTDDAVSKPAPAAVSP